MSEFRFQNLGARVEYTGRELRPGWVTSRTGLAGDAAAVFRGPCHVATADLVDMDDARAGATIDAAEMVHVIVEHPGCSLRLGILRQRLLVSILCDDLRRKGCAVERDGDDVFFNDRKLTVSIAAPAGDSCLIHLGINVDPSGAPVPAVGLEELGVDPDRAITSVMEAYRAELATADHAATKVRQVYGESY